METEEPKKSFWTSLPVILTGIAALIGAVATLFTVLSDGKDGILKQPGPIPPVNSNINNPSSQPQDIDTTVQLSIPNWGKVIAGSSGGLWYKKSQKGKFEAQITLKGLQPNTVYDLTLNGRSDDPSDRMLLGSQMDNNGSKYIDFFSVETDVSGYVNKSIYLYNLQPGQYFLKFFVKDHSDNHKIVLYNNNLRFIVN
jgi:hypothetical protein